MYIYIYIYICIPYWLFPVAGASETTTEPNDEVTTLMIYDIPFKLTINRMVDAIDDHGFVGALAVSCCEQ